MHAPPLIPRLIVVAGPSAVAGEAVFLLEEGEGGRSANLAEEEADKDKDLKAKERHRCGATSEDEKGCCCRGIAYVLLSSIGLWLFCLGCKYSGNSRWLKARRVPAVKYQISPQQFFAGG